MMRKAPDAFDVSRESRRLLDALRRGGRRRKSFAWQCLVTRRLIERGVRVVELIDTGSTTTGTPTATCKIIGRKPLRVDQALRRLIRDLRQRGLLDRRSWRLYRVRPHALGLKAGDKGTQPSRRGVQLLPGRRRRERRA